MNRAGSILTALVVLPLSMWMLRETCFRYVSLREVFMARSVLDGRIGGGDPGKAAEVIQRAIRRVPGEGESHLYLAHYLLHVRKDPNAAITVLRRARFLCDQPDLYLLEARAQISKGNFQAAEPLLKFMAALDRDRPGLHYLLGRVYQGTQRFDEARKEYLADIHWSLGQSSERSSNLDDSFLRLASLLEESGDYEKAVEHYQKFLERMGKQTPTYPLAQLSLARIFRDHLSDWELSEKYFREAIAAFRRQGNSDEVRRIEGEIRELARRRSSLR